MKRGRIILLLAWLAVMLVPVWMQHRVGKKSVVMQAEGRKLTIITPHNETIRREIGRAFEAWWLERKGEKISINWLFPGGSSEIRTVIDGAFQVADRTGRAGIGIDVYFGGGDYEFRKESDKGRLQRLRVFETRADYFSEGQIPMKWRGENYYGERRDWVGVCLASFGICYNWLELKKHSVAEPRQWKDLAEPAYFGKVALADPGKSGSVAKAFEMLVQKEMQLAIAAFGETEEAKEIGWRRGIQLVRRLAANARYFADGATKIPRDVVDGEAWAGLCIDYYGRHFQHQLSGEKGRPRLQLVMPENASSWSVDPVAIFRGSPEEALAQGFVEFLLSDHGQSLWNAKLGSRYGPKERELRRLPIRPAIYANEELHRDFVDADMPYEAVGDFTYRSELTGPIFNPLRQIVRVLCQETHEELKRAWVALVSAGFPQEAMALFEELPGMSYAEVKGPVANIFRSQNGLEQVRWMQQRIEETRLRYLRVEQLAKEGR